MEAAGKRGGILMLKLTKFTAVILVAVMFFSALAPGAPLVRPAEASWDRVAMMGVLYGLVQAAIQTQKDINKEREAILKATQDLQNRAIIEQRFDTTMYAHDHRALSDDKKIDPTSTTRTIESQLYRALTEAGGVYMALAL
jgi:hypothetical protein